MAEASDQIFARLQARAPIRLLSVIDAYPGHHGDIPIGGAETALKRLLEHLRDVYPGEFFPTVFVNRGTLQPSEIYINQTSSEPLILRPKNLRLLKTFLINQQQSFDFLYLADRTLYMRPHLLVPTVIRVKKPMMLRMTSTRQLDYIQRCPRWIRNFIARRHLLPAEKIFRFLVVSHFSQNQFRDIGFPDEKITLIRNAVDLSKFERTQESVVESLKLRSELFPDLSGDKTVFVYVGRITCFHKRIDDLIQAWESSALAQEGHRLLIVGAPKRDFHHADGFQVWKRYGPQNGTSGPGKLKGSYWTGLVTGSDVPKYLHASDVFVLPSDFEGFSNSGIEALAAGLPVIGRKGVSGNDELITDQTGLFFSDIRSLVSALKKLTNFDLRRRLCDGARAHSQNFSIDRTAESFRDLFHQMRTEFENLDLLTPAESGPQMTKGSPVKNVRFRPS